MARAASARGAALIALALATAPAAAQDFRHGLSAYNSGAYAAAAEQWRALAEHNDANAQAALAFMLHKGLGVAQDDAESAYWYGRAAEQGQPEAQLFLGLFYLGGNGVARDYVQSHKWCDLAYSNGANEAALDCRDRSAQQLSPEALGESRRQVAEWFKSRAERPRR